MGFIANLFKPKSQSDDEAEASARMLARLKERRGAETGKWLSLMLDTGKLPAPGPAPTIEDVDRRETLNEAPYSPPLEAMYTSLTKDESEAEAALYTPPALKTSRPAAPIASEPVENETVLWINRLFDEFSRQSTVYNATASGTNLAISVHQPEVTYEEPHYGEAYDAQKKISVFKGHLSTTTWAMLVQGYEERIDVYVIAADEILNFTVNDIRKSQVSPFMSIASKKVTERREWSVGGAKILPEAIPLLAKELLGDLIRISTGTMSEAELFADHAVPLKLGETVAQGYAPSGRAEPQAPTAAPTKSAGVDSLATWAAAEALLSALDQDLAWIASSQGALDEGADQLYAKRLHDLSASLRTLSGQLSSFIAQNHPGTKSKYNAS